MAGTDGGASSGDAEPSARTDGRTVTIGPNDVLRFGLELAALAALGYWGWTAATGPLRVGLAVGVPLVTAVLWGTFRVPDGPGPAPVPVPGAVRLGLEWAVFGLAAVGLAVAGRSGLAATFVLVTAGHYVVARDRVRWLLGGTAG